VGPIQRIKGWRSATPETFIAGSPAAVATVASGRREGGGDVQQTEQPPQPASRQQQPAGTRTWAKLAGYCE